MRNWILGLALTTAAPATAQQALLPVKVEAATGRILVTLPAPDADGVAGRYLYTTGLRTGLGSAELRLDRGMIGTTQVLAFRRLGKKVALTIENHRFRATGDAATQRGARESFPFSTVWMTDIVSTADDGGLVIDFAPFLTQDALDLTAALNEGGGKFRLVDALSAADPASVKIFPDNIEIDAVQTYQPTETPGRQVQLTAPEPRKVSFTVHHSLVRLPAPGFQVRRFDPRSAAGGLLFYDFGSPLGQDVAYQLANHFRIEKIDPAATRSRVKKPIVFYIDPAAPEPVRTALREGVQWWAQAFDAAGLIDAFRTEILPEGADPMDIRYNMVNWGNRVTRGWSYGQQIVDPRTGEIIKGSVVLGSLRVRQDMQIFEALVGTAATNSGTPNDPVRVSLARMRQLGAHEVGHAIGFAHNFAGSTQGRTSVMEYPGPLIKLTDGRVDLSDAYAVDIGEWDKFTVDWLYGQGPPGSDPDAVAATKAAAVQARGMRFVSDVDGRSPDAPSPWGSMWDNGPDPAAELRRMMEVRRAAIDAFGTGMLRPGEPVANLRRKFVPVWLIHRYQVDAAAKLLGGVDLAYTVVDDGQPPPRPVPAGDQMAALDALMATLAPATLTVPDRLQGPLSAGLFGREDPQYTVEVFRNAGSSVFDPLIAADAAAQVTLDTILASSRLTRMYQQHDRDPGLPGLAVVLDRLDTVIATRNGAVARRVAHRTLMSLARAARDPMTSPEVAMILADRLRRTADRLVSSSARGEDAAWVRAISTLLRDEDALEREVANRSHVPAIPPGMPIGDTDWFGADVPY